MPDARDYYGLLGAASSADFQELKRCYYARAKECHPDLFDGDPEKTEEFKRLVNAFNVLSDPVQRRRYDEERGLVDVPARRSSPAPLDEASILDRISDDVLEEYIVGNVIPEGITLQTLFRDLESTNRFLRFREAKNLYYQNQIARALDLFGDCVIQSPSNILARYYFAHCLGRMRRYKEAELQLIIGIQLGEQRDPPLALPRLRRDLLTLRRKKLGLRGRIRTWFSPPPPEAPALMDDPEKMRRSVSRMMTEMARQDQIRGKQSRPPPEIGPS